jgi:hypothetical protein
MERTIQIEKGKRLAAAVVPFAWLAVLGVAVMALHREWGGIHLADLSAALRRIGTWHLACALGLTAVSLLCTAALDWVALRWLTARRNFQST